MRYEVTVAPAAARQLRKFDPHVRRRVQAAIELLAENPRPPAATRLVGGAGEWRVRIGDYRIVYEIHDQVLLVLVLALGHRREIYRNQKSTALTDETHRTRCASGTATAWRSALVSAPSTTRSSTSAWRQTVDESPATHSIGSTR